MRQIQCSVLLLLSCLICYTNSIHKDLSKETIQKMLNDKIIIEYCTSCGYKNNYEQIKNQLEINFPHLTNRIIGKTYGVTGTKQFIGEIILFIQTFGFLVFLGIPAMNMMGINIQIPFISNLLRENTTIFFVSLMLMSMFSQKLFTSGAFEVYYNDKLIFSKLEERRRPSFSELKDLLIKNGLEDINAS